MISEQGVLHFHVGLVRATYTAGDGECACCFRTVRITSGITTGQKPTLWCLREPRASGKHRGAGAQALLGCSLHAAGTYDSCASLAGSLSLSWPQFLHL